ncbi:MAG: sigma-70 family RNA polymerase sigma factor [Gemmatimonadetes bacterium]|nr:sigma-70 family RNA polymerase sigma factor [Gemmatimonadota bacterium]MCC7134091.1 sigma-70 family RNA polymerase sigma factor [Gemmatimonadales bacterium]
MTPGTPPAGSDPELSRLAQGDECAFGILLERHWPGVVGYAARLVASAEVAQDIAQEAFVRLWDRRAEWTGTDARPILFRIARNLGYDHCRAEAVRGRWASAQRRQGIPVSMPDVGAVEAEDLRTAIERALAALSDREREVVILSRLRGLPRAEVAVVTGLAPGTVSNLLSSAMARLWQMLEPHLGERPTLGAGRRLRRI